MVALVCIGDVTKQSVSATGVFPLQGAEGGNLVKDLQGHRHCGTVFDITVSIVPGAPFVKTSSSISGSMWTPKRSPLDGAPRRAGEREEGDIMRDRRTLL